MTSFALPRLPKPAVHPRCIQLSHGGPLTRPGSRGVQPNPQHVKYNPASRELEVYTDWSARDTMSREGRRRTLHRIHNRALSGTQQLKQRPSLNTVPRAHTKVIAQEGGPFSTMMGATGRSLSAAGFHVHHPSTTSHIAPLCRRSGVKAFRRGFKDKAREARVQHEQKEQLEKDLGEFNWRNTRHPIRPALGLGIIDSLYLSETFV